MHHFPLHIGDYDATTSHLTWVEDTAFSRTLRICYRTEKPLPADVAEVCRLVRAKSKLERDAVETVLREFYTLRDDGWHNTRADKEIAKYQQKSNKAKASANARWSQSERNANALLTNNREPEPITPSPSHSPPCRSSPGEGEEGVDEKTAIEFCTRLSRLGVTSTASAIDQGLQLRPLADLVAIVDHFESEFVRNGRYAFERPAGVLFWRLTSPEHKGKPPAAGWPDVLPEFAKARLAATYQPPAVEPPRQIRPIDVDHLRRLAARGSHMAAAELAKMESTAVDSDPVAEPLRPIAAAAMESTGTESDCRPRLVRSDMPKRPPWATPAREE